MVNPDLAATICEERAGKPVRIHYDRVKDGVHPTDTTLVNWAKKLHHAININRHFNAPINFDEYIPSASDVENE